MPETKFVASNPLKLWLSAPVKCMTFVPNESVFALIAFLIASFSISSTMITSPCWKDALLSDQLNVNPLSVCNCSLVGLTLVVSAHLFALNEKLSTATTTSSVEADNLKKKNPAFTVSGATNSGNLNEA